MCSSQGVGRRWADLSRERPSSRVLQGLLRARNRAGVTNFPLFNLSGVQICGVISSLGVDWTSTWACLGQFF